MANRTCPQCGYPLHRSNHPFVVAVRFCRRDCIRRWMQSRGIVTTKWIDVFVVDQRRF
jgi:hypothetical protein